MGMIFKREGITAGRWVKNEKIGMVLLMVLLVEMGVWWLENLKVH
jgi:hypothetical protein